MGAVCIKPLCAAGTANKHVTCEHLLTPHKNTEQPHFTDGEIEPQGGRVTNWCQDSRLLGVGSWDLNPSLVPESTP